VFCQGLVAKLNTNIAQLAYDGHAARIFYGEQERYPTVPAFCVEPVNKVLDTGNPYIQRVFDLTFTAQVIGYLAVVQKGEQVVRQDIDILGEKAETIINSDHTLGGLTRDLLVTSLESGYAYKNDTKYKAVILTVEGTSREGLPC
jgi:hypothetical protein